MPSISERSLRLVFRVLRIWACGSDKPTVFFDNDRLYSPSTDIPDWTGPRSIQELQDRVAFVASSLGLIPKSSRTSISYFAKLWADELTASGRITRDRMRAIVHSDLEGVSTHHTVDAWARIASALDLDVVAPEIGDLSLIDTSDTENRQALQAALRTWQADLENDVRWSTVPSIVPGEPDAPIDDIYVDLYAIDAGLFPENDAGNTGKLRTQLQQLDPTLYPLIDANSMLSRTKERAVVVGDPGAGKSTLIKWIARSVIAGKTHDFALPVVIPLGEYAAWRQTRVDLYDPLAFFLLQNGVSEDRIEACAEMLRTRNAGSGAVVLLFDGWDEVPRNQRADVRSSLLKASQGFVTILTSRPSGVPRQLAVGASVDVYELAGLSRPSIEVLASNVLACIGKSVELQGLLVDLDQHADVAAMAANPFLLTLLCMVRGRVLRREGSTHSSFDLYDESVYWITEQYNAARVAREPFGPGHRQGLRDLAYELLFTRPDPRYVFRLSHLDNSLVRHAGIGTEAVLGSRMVGCLNPSTSEHAFIHATFQEFFAAEAMSDIEPETLAQLLQSIVLVDSQRFEVTRFLAGMGGGRRRFSGLSSLVPW